MKIGDYFVEKGYIEEKHLLEALKIQRENSGQRIGEILVNMDAISKPELDKYIGHFLEEIVDANLGDWLSQDDVDRLIMGWKAPRRKQDKKTT